MKTLPNTRAEDALRKIGEALRDNAELVEKYLDHAKRYADLVHSHAQVVCEALFPQAACRGTRCLAALALQHKANSPQQVQAKLEALAKGAAAQGVTITHVIPCLDSMTVYVFGHENTPHQN